MFNQFDLESKIDSLALPTFTSSPAKTKVFLFITISDISQESTIQKINSLRESGGVVALVKANTALDNRNFVQIVSNGGLLFETRNFNENPYMRHIERQLCIGNFCFCFCSFKCYEFGSLKFVMSKRLAFFYCSPNNKSFDLSKFKASVNHQI